MRLTAILIGILFSTGLVFADDKLNPNFDFSGVNKFWKLKDILKSDVEPTQEQWDDVFGTPGYAELFRREFKVDLFKRLFRAAYMPSRKHEIESMIAEAKRKGGYWKGWYPSMFETLEYAEKYETEIKDKVNSFNTFSYTASAIKELQLYLPEKVKGNPPDVSFIIFNDSRGYTPVIMSINHLYRDEASLTEEKLQKLKKGGFTKHRPHVLYFAHEFFHYYRSLKDEIEYPKENHEDSGLIWYLDQIENEGIADQINIKQIMMEGQVMADSKMGMKVKKEQGLVADNLRKFDAILAQIKEKPDQINELCKGIRKVITRSGHPAGFFMANVIVEQMGKDILKTVVRNPFKFFVLYNDAAKKNKDAPVFSDKAMSMIKDLDQKYRCK